MRSNLAAKMRREVEVQPRRGRKAGPARYDRGGSLDALKEVPPPEITRTTSAGHEEWRTRRAKEEAARVAVRAAEERVLRAVRVCYQGDDRWEDAREELWRAAFELRAADRALGPAR